jgi:hypothetical protein
MRTDVYTAITPFGAVEVDFPEDGGSIFDGPEGAVAHLKAVMAVGVNAMGMTMTENNLEPSDFLSFCQPAGSGITIVEPLDDLVRYGSAVDAHDVILDSVDSPIARARQAKEIYDRLRPRVVARESGK